MFAWSTSAVSINITILCIVISTPQLTINKTRVLRTARTNFLYKFNSVNTPVLYIMRVIVSTHFSGSNRVTEHARACSEVKGKKKGRNIGAEGAKTRQCGKKASKGLSKWARINAWSCRALCTSRGILLISYSLLLLARRISRDRPLLVNARSRKIFARSHRRDALL